MNTQIRNNSLHDLFLITDCG